VTDEEIRRRVEDLGRILEAERPVDLLPTDPDCMKYLEAAVGRIERREPCSCQCGLPAPAGKRYIKGHNPKVHGWWKTPEWRAYHGAKTRCTNPKREDWPLYGGRGIEFRFTSVPEFVAAIGRRPGPEYTVDRINPDGHYEAGNVKWSTATEQAANRRRSGRPRSQPDVQEIP